MEQEHDCKFELGPGMSCTTYTTRPACHPEHGPPAQAALSCQAPLCSLLPTQPPMLCLQSTYTGVHARGGPSTVEPSKDLSALLGRSEPEPAKKAAKPVSARSARRPPTPDALPPLRPISSPLPPASESRAHRTQTCMLSAVHSSRCWVLNQQGRLHGGLLEPLTRMQPPASSNTLSAAELAPRCSLAHG